MVLWTYTGEFVERKLHERKKEIQHNVTQLGKEAKIKSNCCSNLKRVKESNLKLPRIPVKRVLFPQVLTYNGSIHRIQLNLISILLLIFQALVLLLLPLSLFSSQDSLSYEVDSLSRQPTGVPTEQRRRSSQVSKICRFLSLLFSSPL